MEHQFTTAELSLAADALNVYLRELQLDLQYNAVPPGELEDHKKVMSDAHLLYVKCAVLSDMQGIGRLTQDLNK